MNIEKLLERLIPFDDVYSKEQFLSVLTPELKEVLEKKINSNNKWRNKAENEQVYFILNDDRWKRPNKLTFKPTINITFIGKDEKPVISIYYLS